MCRAKCGLYDTVARVGTTAHSLEIAAVYSGCSSHLLVRGRGNLVRDAKVALDALVLVVRSARTVGGEVSPIKREFATKDAFGRARQPLINSREEEHKRRHRQLVTAVCCELVS
jgi:hypothetical protein